MYKIVSNHNKHKFVKNHLGLLNAFRKEYFNDPNVELVGPQQFAQAHNLGIIPLTLYRDNIAIGMAECTVSNFYGQKGVSVSTVYIKPSHRGKGLSNFIYDFVEYNSPEHIVGIQVEETSLLANWQKLVDQGFNWFDTVMIGGNGLTYNEPTYMLFRKQYLKRIPVLKKSNIDNLTALFPNFHADTQINIQQERAKLYA